MIDEELKKLLIEKERREIGRNYRKYVEYCHKSIYTPTRHGDFICQVIQDAIDKRKKMIAGKIPMERQYIMLHTPPQHGKSMTITETLPSFFLGNFPEEGVIVTGYDEDFAIRFGETNRNKITQYGEWLWGIQVTRGSTSKSDWKITGAGINKGVKYRGGMISRSILAGVTGSSYGDLIIIDDPVKSRKEANSEAIRNQHWGEWKDSLFMRRHPATIYILIMTRWHEDDLAGRLLNPEYGEPLDWKVYNLTLEAEENDMLGRKVGEPLWAERYGYDFIAEAKRQPDSFNALCQGRPTAIGGNIIKTEWWKYYDNLPDIQYKILTVDATFKDTETSDRVSLQVWGKRGADMYLIDNHTARMGFVATIQAIKNMLAKHPGIRAKCIEDKANGSAIIEILRRYIGGIIPIKADASTGGKVARVQGISMFIESGNVYIPRNAEYTRDFIYECSAFPNGKNDDQVDGMAIALNRFMGIYAPVSENLPQQQSGFFRREREQHDTNEISVNSEVEIGGW